MMIQGLHRSPSRKLEWLRLQLPHASAARMPWFRAGMSGERGACCCLRKPLDPSPSRAGLSLSASEPSARRPGIGPAGRGASAACGQRAHWVCGAVSAARTRGASAASMRGSERYRAQHAGGRLNAARVHETTAAHMSGAIAARLPGASAARMPCGSLGGGLHSP